MPTEMITISRGSYSFMVPASYINPKPGQDKEEFIERMLDHMISQTDRINSKLCPNDGLTPLEDRGAKLHCPQCGFSQYRVLS